MSDPAKLADRLGHEFRDPGLLDAALVHASRASEEDGGHGNERLEYLGDAVLDLVIADALFAAHADWDEGALTRARAALVNKKALARRARAIGLGALIRHGRTEVRSGGSKKETILADCFEAVIGALYLDGGLAPVRTLCERLFGDAIGEPPPEDPKTQFQEWAHAHVKETPRYRTTGDTGEEQDDARFTVEVWVQGRCWGQGVGRSKRSAERAAAYTALQEVARRDG